MKDELKSPEHYTHGKAECWDWYEAGMSDEEFRGAMKNNIYKYTYRAGHKGEAVKDLRKAIQYLERWIAFEGGDRCAVTKRVAGCTCGTPWCGCEDKEEETQGSPSYPFQVFDETGEVTGAAWVDVLAHMKPGKIMRVGEIHPDDNFQPRDPWYSRLFEWLKEKYLWS